MIENRNDSALQKLRHRMRSLVWSASWVALSILFVFAILLQWAGDSTWLMTLLTFGPRWTALLLLAPLAGGALLFCRRAWLPLLLAAGIAVGPIMGFCVPWRSVAQLEPAGTFILRVVSFNVGGGIDTAGMIRFLRETHADVIAFQEWPGLPFPEKIERGWFSVQHGELLVASRFPITNMSVSPNATARRRAPAIGCDIETPGGKVHVQCLHLYTLRNGLDAVISQKWKGAPELERVTAIRNEESKISADFARTSDAPAIVVGDFNMTCDSTIFDRDWKDWHDAFSLRGFGLGHTFSSRKIGLRIDHVLVSSTSWHVRSCRVGPDLHGQHRPLVAELVLLGHD